MEALMNILTPLVADGVAKLLQDEVNSLQKEFPGSSPYEAVGKAIAKLLSEAKIPPDLAKNLNLANTLAKFSNLNAELVKSVFDNPVVNDLREFAVHFDTAAIQKVVGDGVKQIADMVRTEVFKTEPTGTVEGMVRKDKFPLINPDPAIKQDVINVLSKLHGNAISHTSMTTIATKQPDVVKDVALERLPAVTNELKAIARVQMISPTTKSMEHLMNNGLTTSLAISQIPKASFVAGAAEAMTAPVAAQVHANATNTVIRNESILVNLHQTLQGTGLLVIDGEDLADQRTLAMQPLLRQQGLDLNIQNLFGSMDQCICDDCTTVYSPASYFVELLNFLRNNNLDPLKPNVPTSVAGQPDDIKGTVLEKLFRRRPDLGNLELTCENTNTILPYIDLANEVMESFIVNLDAYAMDTNLPPQATIEVFNVGTEDSAELLSQPQNINYDAYRTLSTAVYPFTLPYHLPISQSRVFLSFLKVARSDLVDLFRHKPPLMKPFPNSNLSAEDLKNSLHDLQKTALDRQVSAELLGMVQEEYIILTKEAFFVKKYFEVTENITPELSVDEYQQRIGVRDVQTYWGYSDNASMLSTDDNPTTGFTGLCFVKAQFLPRSGVTWVDLVQIVQTNFINTYMPKGKAKTVFDELKFSYRFLQTLVDRRQNDKKRRLGKLAEFLVRASKLISIAQLLYDDSSSSNTTSSNGNKSATKGSKGSKTSSKNACCVSDDEVRDWVFDNFENMGRLVVLDFNEGPFLGDGAGGQLQGDVFVTPNETSSNPQPTMPPPGLKQSPTNGSIGTLSPDGQITDASGIVFANVTINGQVLIGSAASGKTLNDQYPQYSFLVQLAGKTTSIISGGYLRLLDTSNTQPVVQWELNENMGSGCNIDNVRIQHLDGTSLGLNEWDKMHRFIRLWQKLGWSIIDTDRAIVGLSDPVLCPDNTVPVVNGTSSSKGMNGTGTGTDNGTLMNGFTNALTSGTTDADDILITFDDYTNSSSSAVNGSGSGSGPGTGSGTKSGTSVPRPDVNPCLVMQLGAVNQIMPFAGLPVEKLLCFWTDIPTVSFNSDKSLYQKLFFTSNLKSNDPVFGADTNGDYFTGAPAKISDNLSVIMAAYGLNADDVRYLLGLTPDPFGTANPAVMADILNIASLSQIYRYALLARVLGIKIYDVHRVIEGFQDPFTSATIFWEMLQTWNIMEQISFSWEELRYIVDEIQTPDDPLSPDPTAVLLTAKTLNDGIQGIKSTYLPPVDASLDATDIIVKARLALVVDDNTANGIMGLLDGSTVYTVRAPTMPPTMSLTNFQNDMSIVSNKLTYVPGVGGRSSQLLVKGILTSDELENAKGLGDDFVSATTVSGTGSKMTKVQLEKAQAAGDQLNKAWVAAVVDASQQPVNVFNNLIKGIFDDATVKLEMDSKTRVILAGDIPEDDTNPPPDARKPSQKRLFFLQKFIPYLQQKLARVLVSDTVISAVGFNDSTLAKTILENVAVSKTNKEITLDYLLQLLNPPSSANALNSLNFEGWIVVPNSDSYMFVVALDHEPPALILDEQSLSFTKLQDDPERVWATSAVALKTGKLYTIRLQNLDMTTLKWKPATASLGSVPSSSFLPQIAKNEALSVFDRLQKTAILVNHFKLTSDEVIYIHDHSSVFADMTFNSLNMTQWKRMQSYYQFRESLPQRVDLNLLDLFNWAANNLTVTGDVLAGKITQATSWKQVDVSDVLSRVNFSTGLASDFQSEEILVRIAQLITFSQTIAVEIPRLFHWSSPWGTASKDFFKLRDVSEDIKKVARSKFDLSNWADAVRPINDVLRVQQQSALVAYLLVQDEVTKQGVTDADSLFEFFLIDVQMLPLVETSRIKQAIATVQVYVQRVLLGLEAVNNVTPNSLDKARWDWMSRYRLWEANRKVFLYPENWIDPTLRDDKSDFFLKLEGALLQKDLSQDTVTTAVRSFLYSVNEVANMEIVALCVETLPSDTSTTTVATSITTTTTTTTTTDGASTTATKSSTASQDPVTTTTVNLNAKIHLFARTSVSPYSYYYISYSMGNWTSWSKMDIEIPYFTMTLPDGQDGPVGNYMSPIVFDGRLLVFIPQMLKKTIPNSDSSGDTFQTLGGKSVGQNAPQEQWELKMSFTELRNGKWIQRQLCPDAVLVKNDPNPDPSQNLPPSPIRPIEGFAFVAAEIVGPPPTTNGGTGASSTVVPYGVRILAGRIVDIPMFILQDDVFSGIAIWDFIDGQLNFSADVQSSSMTISAGGITPITATPMTTRFQYQMPSNELHSMQATDNLALNSNPITMDSYNDAPFVSKGSVAISPNLSVSASSRAILTKKDITITTNGTLATTKQYLLYHKFIHPMMAVSVGVIAPGDTMPLSPLYSYLSGLSNTPTPFPTLQIMAVANPKPAATTSVVKTLAPTSGSPVVTLVSDVDEAFGGVILSPKTEAHSFNERGTPYSIYNWEIGLHAPMILIDRLLNSQQFDQALDVCHYVFNPMVQGDKKDMTRFWIFAPFRQIQTQTTEQMFMQYVANTFRQDVSDWRDAPFQPHVIARGRPQAYMMWIVMKYIEILIAYGDYYFRQNTLETIPDAIQMYILASHIYGPRGQLIPRQNPQKKYTYNELATKFDAFGNAMVQLEDAFPFSNQTPLPIGKLPNDPSAPLANVFGFSGTLLFAIPDNPNLIALGDTIDDRLFKIRHSQDINGITRILPLFEPPIDPGLLVQAAAQGLSLSSVLQDLNGPMPNYRFQYLLQKALDLAMEVKSFGSALVAAREKMDFESLSVLRAKHDTATQTALMDMKKLAVDEANSSLEALQYSRNAPVNRLQFYLQQVGADLSGVPTIDNEFQELINKIDTPIQDGGLQLSPFEKEEMDNYALAADQSTAVGVMEVIASIANILPNVSVNIEPFGCGMSAMFGGSNIGAEYSAIARALSMQVSSSSYQAGTAGRKSQAQRALQERILQANAAGYEISAIDKQVTVNKIRIALANKDIDIQQKQIDQMQEVEDFLRQKYSNVALYSWMEGTIQSLFYDTYTQAYDLAKKTEKAFHYERPDLASTSFIQPGYWDSTRDGLFSGEQLYSALKQLEAKYLESRGYDYEITKSVSLRQLDPMALMTLRESGACTFNIPEILFDMDFPGHYMRRLKSVSASVPCIVGPYTSINSTLRLTQNKIRFLPTKATGTGYDEVLDPSAGLDSRFATNTAPIPAIAVCSGQSDTGTFELNFHDDRYLPFEGAGAISWWSFSLPQHDNFRQFNYESITDVIITLRYTSVDGGGQMLQGAKDAVQRYIKAVDYISTSGGLFALFDLKNEFATSWAMMLADQAANGTTTGAFLNLPNLNEKLPVFATARTQVQVQASDIWVVSDGAFPGSAGLGLVVVGASQQGGLTLAPEPDRNGMKSYHLKSEGGLVVGSWKLQMASGDTVIAAKRAWMLVRYYFK